MVVEPPPRPWPLGVFLGDRRPALDSDGYFSDIAEFEAGLARRVRRFARLRGWRASLHGHYEARDPRYDPDTRIDITIADTTFAVIIWGCFRLGEAGWVSVERLPDTGPVAEVFTVLREALGTMPGVVIVADPKAGPQ